MNKAKRNRMAASGALHMAKDKGQTVGIAVDDDAKAQDMLKLVLKEAKKDRLKLGKTIQGDGVITVPVGEGEVRIVSADRLVKPGPGLN